MDRFIISILLTLIAAPIFASHNRSGEITYRMLDANTVECVLKTYTKASSIPADRDSLNVCWGDGNCEWLQRANGDGEGEELEGDYKRNIYTGIHTYSENGVYLISMRDPNRNQGILNINSGDSDNIRFYIESEIHINGEMNDSPLFLEEPLDFAFAGQPFIHVISSYDLDGDSLAYRMAVPLMDSAQSVPNYMALDEIAPGAGNVLGFDEELGVLTWDSPQTIGEYNIAFEVLSYRNGVLNARVVRDIQILVLNGANEPPLVELVDASVEGTVVEVAVGDTVQLEINATEPDGGQSLELSSSSFLYGTAESPAVFQVEQTGDNNRTGLFYWEVAAEHIQAYPHNIVFKAKDDQGLADYVVLRYRVGDTTSPSFPIQPTAGVIRLYPVPVHDILEVDGVPPGVRYSVIDLRGSVRKHGAMPANAELDMGAMENGIYFIQINGRVVGKVVVFR